MVDAESYDTLNKTHGICSLYYDNQLAGKLLS